MELPREKLLRLGAEALTDAELLALFLRTGSRGRPVLGLAHQLLQQFGGLGALLRSNHQQMCSAIGIGPAKACQLAAIMEMACRYRHDEISNKAMTNPQSTRLWLTTKLGRRRQEVFAALYLDSRHRLLSYEELFFGTIDGAAVHPREVARRALELDAAAIIVCHNHPSGVAEPSAQDRAITKRLRSALALIDVTLLDHFIIAHDNMVSMAELGMV